MTHSDKSALKLGFGLMRLPRLEDGSIDVAQTAEMADRFLAAGGTYFDTAYVYEGSEEAARKALVERHPRDSYTIATKLNARIGCTDESSAKQQFFTSLKRLGVEYFDFYLLHALGEGNADKYDEYHLWDFVKEQKASGLIRHMGFSFHGGPELLDKLLTDHPETDFVQLQLNYADWENPDVRSRENYETARRHGKYITVMEPVKGGLLADPPKSVRDIFTAADPDASFASWAIRYIASKEGILTVLSGMSDLAQMDDNLSYMKDFKPLTEAEEKTIDAAREALAAVKTIPCTGCGYCTGGCPMSIPIPRIFRARNLQLQFEQDEKARENYRFFTRNKGKASDCVGCLQCEGVCPQGLPVARLLSECVETLE